MILLRTVEPWTVPVIDPQKTLQLAFRVSMFQKPAVTLEPRSHLTSFTQASHL